MADQFYSRDEEGRFETHETEAAARRDAEEILDNCQEQASDSGWPEGTGDIEWGRLVPLGECVASNKRESDRSDFDYLVDYNLKDLADPTAIADELIWNRGVITVSYAFDPVEAGIRSSERYVPASELEAAQYRAIAAKARVEELEHQLQDVRSVATNALDELRDTQSVADLARQIGESRRRALTAHLRASTPDYRNAKAELEVLLDQAAALARKAGS